MHLTASSRQFRVARSFSKMVRSVGAVGVSGDLSEKDEFCACKGIQKAGYASEPAELDESWR